MYFNEDVQKGKVYLLLSRMWEVQTNGNNT